MKQNLKLTSSKTPQEIVKNFDINYIVDFEIQGYEPEDVEIPYRLYWEVYDQLEAGLWKNPKAKISRIIGQYGSRDVYITGRSVVVIPHPQKKLNGNTDMFHYLSNDEFYELISQVVLFPDGPGVKHPINRNRINSHRREWVEKILLQVLKDLQEAIEDAYREVGLTLNREPLGNWEKTQAKSVRYHDWEARKEFAPETVHGFSFIEAVTISRKK